MDLAAKRLRFDALYRANWHIWPPAKDKEVARVWFRWLDPLPLETIETAITVVARDWGSRPGRPGLAPFKDAVLRGGHSADGREYDFNTDSDATGPTMWWHEYKRDYLEADFCEKPAHAELLAYLLLDSEIRRRRHRYVPPRDNVRSIGDVIAPGLQSTARPLASTESDAEPPDGGLPPSTSPIAGEWPLRPSNENCLERQEENEDVPF